MDLPDERIALFEQKVRDKEAELHDAIVALDLNKALAANYELARVISRLRSLYRLREAREDKDNG